MRFPKPDVLRQVRGERLLLGLAWTGLLLLIGGGLWLDIELFWSLRRLEHAPPLAVPTDPAAGAGALAQRHLFGMPGSGPAPAAAAPSEFRLLGVLAGRDHETGAAILLVEGEKRPLVVRVGQDIANGIRLSGLAARQAFIDRNGTRQTLELPAPAPGPAQAVEPLSPSRTTPSD